MRVLIISPNFPPSNVADHMRVRLILPYLAEYGWQAEVLAVDSASVPDARDPWLVGGLPPAVPIHRVRGLGLGWSRIPGLGSVTFRALRALGREGNRLLKNGHFDLVYFSTTRFGVHVLGPRWQQKFGTPFAMDYQDPWVNDYYRNRPEIVPPGGRMKYAVVDWLNRRQEPKVLRHCAGITSVSPGYPSQLGERYRWLAWVGNGELESQRSAENKHSILSEVLPFPGDTADLERVARDGTRQDIFSPNDGCRHWVYAGRGGDDMARALRGIFGALQNAAKARPEFLKDLRLHFIGTSYAGAGKRRKTVEPLAEAFGLGGVVQESPGRLPYSQTLRCLLDADALIVPGSDDPAYTASKIYPYLLAKKPLLAVFHEDSSVVSLIRRVRGAVAVAFRSGEPESDISLRIGQSWLADGQYTRAVPLDEAAFEPNTARAQAGQLADFFKRCAARRGSV